MIDAENLDLGPEDPEDVDGDAEGGDESADDAGEESGEDGESGEE